MYRHGGRQTNIRTDRHKEKKQHKKMRKGKNVQSSFTTDGGSSRFLLDVNVRPSWAVVLHDLPSWSRLLSCGAFSDPMLEDLRRKVADRNTTFTKRWKSVTNSRVTRHFYQFRSMFQISLELKADLVTEILFLGLCLRIVPQRLGRGHDVPGEH